jgi:PAS domain S-box-containing protein
MTDVEQLVERALAAAAGGERGLREALDRIPAAVYVTDEQGVVTYFNPACVDFTGRRPEVGRDRWCVTWRLYTTEGEFLPHAECPMAVAINTRRPVRGVTALAERPDGTRVTFQPWPTPIFDKDGRFQGAVNVLEEVTDEVRAREFLAQARRCRRLAGGVDDAQASETLGRMAEEFEAKAAALQAGTAARSRKRP